MKKALAVSVLLNLLLAACLVSSLMRQDSNSTPAHPETAQTETPVSDSEAPITQVQATAEPSPTAEFSQAAQNPAPSNPNYSKKQPVLLPLVFQNVDLSQLILNADQLEAIDDLRQRFLDEIGGLQQDPRDPAYRQRWLKSQPQIDNDLRGMIGVAAFQNYQIEAADLAERRKTAK
jgi:hypothetical protein